MFWYTIHNYTHQAVLPAAKKCLGYGYPKNITRKTYQHTRKTHKSHYSLNRSKVTLRKIPSGTHVNFCSSPHNQSRSVDKISRTPLAAFQMVVALVAFPFHPLVVVLLVDHIRRPLDHPYLVVQVEQVAVVGHTYSVA